MKKPTLTTLLLLTSLTAIGQVKKDSAQTFAAPWTSNTILLSNPDLTYRYTPVRPISLTFTTESKTWFAVTGINNGITDSLTLHLRRSQLVWINDTTAVVKPLKNK